MDSTDIKQQMQQLNFIEEPPKINELFFRDLLDKNDNELKKELVIKNCAVFTM